MSAVEAKYDQLHSNLQNELGPIDANFAMRLMYLERKVLKSSYPSVKPHVVLTIKYKQGIDRENKKSKLRTKYGMMVESIDNPQEILVVGYMDMNDITKISSDSDIDKITGKASPVIRG